MNNVLRLFPEPEPVAAPVVEPTRFEEIWKYWPRKEGKPLARAKYAAIISGKFKTRTMDRDSGTYAEIELSATEEEIIRGSRAYLESQFDKSTYRYKDGGKFIPHFATFLNRGGWEGFI
jgi:hypothetical protein